MARSGAVLEGGKEGTRSRGEIDKMAGRQMRPSSKGGGGQRKSLNYPQATINLNKGLSVAVSGVYEIMIKSTKRRQKKKKRR